MRQRLRFTGIALIISAVLALLIISVYAVSGRTADDQLQGRVLLWHAYTGPEAEAFEEMLNRFRAIYPNVTIMQQSFPGVDALQEAYLNAVGTGLGPDVILGPSGWIGSMAPQGQISPLTQALSEDVWQRHTAATLDTVTYNNDYYALPLALNTLALYYNRPVVSTPVATIDALERQAAEGLIILMSTTFRDAFWGINAFGGRLFDENQRVVLDQGGFANWLAWLSNLRNYPGVILDNNRDALRNRFILGDAAYYVGYASELSLIIEGLGLENVGVAPLPAGPVGGAGPFLELTAFMYSPVSSNNQRKIALELGQFLSNTEQSGALMRRVRAVPANQRVRINPRLNPIVSSFAAQARSAVPLLNTPEMNTVLQLGGDAYLRVLDGGIPPAEAAVAVTNQINQANQREVVDVPAHNCARVGTLRLLHSWEGSAADALDELIARFRTVCPNIIVNADYDTPDDILARLDPDIADPGRAYTFIGSSGMIQNLMDNEPRLRDLTPYISSELLQRFQPNAIDTMRYQRVLYGLPIHLQLDGLYFNRNLAPVPAQTLDDLRAQTGQGVPIELDINFETAFWGAAAFGARLFDNEYRVILDHGGMAEWLNWLHESRDVFGMNLTFDTEELRNRFEAGQTAYYVGGPQELAFLQEALGPDALGVATLPDGPGGPAAPLLSADGFLFSRNSTDNQITLALEFIQFVTNAENQTYLADAANLVPVNATIDMINGSPIDVFMSLARIAITPVNTFHMETVRQLGDDYYTRVLVDAEDPIDVTGEVTAGINERNGIAPLPTPVPMQPVSPPRIPSLDDTAESLAPQDETVEGDPESEETPDANNEIPPTGRE